MEPKDYWAAVRSGWKQICACLVVALVVGGGIVWTQSAVASSYQAARKIYVTSGASPQPGAEAPTSSYVELVGGTLLAEQVSDELGYEVPAGTAAVAAVTSKVMEISVTDATRERADEIADAYVDLLPAQVERLDEPGGPAAFTTISSATVEVQPSGGGRILLLAGMLGLGCGLAWAFSRHAARMPRGDRA